MTPPGTRVAQLGTSNFEPLPTMSSVRLIYARSILREFLGQSVCVLAPLLAGPNLSTPCSLAWLLLGGYFAATQFSPAGHSPCAAWLASADPLLLAQLVAGQLLC